MESAFTIKFENNNVIPFLDEKIEKETRFWFIEEKIVKEETQVKYKFDHVGLMKFLMHYQIGRYRPDEDRITYIHAHDQIVREVKVEDIKDFVLAAAESEDDYALMQMLYMGSTNYLSEAKINHLKFMNLRFLQNLQKVQYLHFQNSSIEIDSKGVRKVDLKALKGFIWESEIIKVKLALDEKPMLRVINSPEGLILDKSNMAEARKSDFYKYLAFTSFYNHRDKEKDFAANKFQIEDDEMNEQGILSKLSAFGYLLHGYKDSSCTRAIICMDSKMTEVGSSFGRTGKSLFGKAVGKFLKYYYINGRDPKFGQENHTYDGFQKNMKLIWVDDADQNLSFSMFYTLITGEFTVNSKNETKLRIPFEESPKLLITTNHAIKGDDPSDLARQFLLGFSDYFSEERTPVDALGQRLFDDWSAAQWNYFYNLCFCALQIYLEHGLIEASIDSLSLRRLRQSIGEIFISWAEIFFDNQHLDEDVEKFVAYGDFDRHYPNYTKKFCDIRNFKKKLKLYATFMGYVYNKDQPDKDGKPNSGDIKSNGKEYFKYSTVGIAKKEADTITPEAVIDAPF